MKPPGCWRTGGMLADVLSPLQAITEIATATRLARPGWRAPVPVICCGNATVGGAGKTPLALDLLHRLHAQGIAAHALTRGHGGRLRGPLHVDAAYHTADDVGDEALLLAEAAPVWIGADRGATARVAVAEGAQALVLDDGLQNPTLEKTASLLVIDGGQGFGNGRLLPAGPLREPVAVAAARCVAAVLIGPDSTGALDALPASLPVLRARLVPSAGMRALTGERVLAFAGIGRPEKFFATLRDVGACLAGTVPFPDHHRFSPGDLRRLRQAADRANARLVTTAKDHVRLPVADRAGVVRADVALEWQDEAAVQAVLNDLFR